MLTCEVKRDSFQSEDPVGLKFSRLVDYLFLLANAVSSGLGLQVILRVPVRVEDDYSVCRGQVDPQTSSSGGQQEAEVLPHRWQDSYTSDTWKHFKNISSASGSHVT